AALGAGYAVASCLEGLAWLSLLPVKAAAGFVMVRAAFGARRLPERARLTALFWLVSCAVAGGALALGKVSDAAFFAGGGYYLDVPFRVVAAAAAAGWALTGLLFRGEAKARQTARVHLDFAGRGADFSLLVDTGNDLSDPVSGKPALVLDRRAAARVLHIEAAVPLAGLRADNAPAVLAALPGAYRTQFQLLPYRAVGRETGLLLAFRPERAARDGKPWPGLAAISPERVANGQYEGLIGL
ncbi:MAG: sigma-E processing peptidase SpoIIGA, partial [Butyricicoccus sp.]|nr:sigma-E processing peptidase SpoIIGA [Butyricicoccus sp.]